MEESLKICHLCSPPLSLRAASQVIYLPKELEVSFPEVHLYSLTDASGPQLHQPMVTAAQAASTLDVPSYLVCIRDHQIQDCIPSGRAVCYLAQEVILHSRSFLACLQLPVLPSK